MNVTTLENNLLLDDDGEPLRAYHGTKYDFKDFDPTRNANGLIFLSTVRGFAEEWAEERATGPGPVRIIEANLTMALMWDYRNAAHRESLLGAIRQNGIQIHDVEMFKESIEDGDWMCIERTPGVLDLIRGMGFQGMFITEGSDMDRNLAVFDPALIKVLDPAPPIPAGRPRHRM